MPLLKEILAAIPDTLSLVSAERWASEGVRKLHALTINPEVPMAWLPVDGRELADHSNVWTQRFINAALMADWACYAKKEDRADYGRLGTVIREFPKGFRIWFCPTLEGFMPAGYTGWYPIEPDTFHTALSSTHELTHRGDLKVQKNAPATGSFIWIFNYSIIELLRKTNQSREMLSRYALDVAKAQPAGLAAAIITEESKGVARRFKMEHVGTMTHTGVEEEVWAVEFSTSIPRPTQMPRLS